MAKKVKFSEEVLSLDDRAEEKPQTMEEYLESVRNSNFTPLRAPALFGQALNYAAELRAEDEGVLVSDISPGVLRMMESMRFVLGAKFEAADSDFRSVRPPAVVVARVDGWEEGSELVDGLLRCMRDYSARVGRAVPRRVAGCAFGDDPLLLLSDVQRAKVLETITRGGAIEGRACSRCDALYADDARSARVERREITEFSAHAVSDAEDPDSRYKLALANRGLLVMRGIDGEGAQGILRKVLSGESVCVDSESMTPDVLVICLVGWEETIPDWLVARALIVESERPSRERDLAYAIGRGISTMEAEFECHVAPQAVSVAAWSELAAECGRGAAGALSTIRDALEAADRCLTHKESFRAFAPYCDDNHEALSDISSRLYGTLEKDVLKARASSGSERYERIAAGRLAEEYLLPLGMVRRAHRLGVDMISDQIRLLEEFENAMRVSGSIRDTSDDFIRSLRDDVFDAYEFECEALAREGEAAFRVSEDEEEPERAERSLPIDMGSLRYDRYVAVGGHLDKTTLPTLRNFRKESSAGDEKGVRRTTLDMLIRHYGYCVACAEEALEVVVGDERFYTRRWVPLSGVRYEVA